MDNLLPNTNDANRFACLQDSHPFTNLKEELRMKKNEKSTFLPYLDRLSDDDFPPKVYSQAVTDTVGALGCDDDDFGKQREDSATDAQKSAIAKALRERRFNTATITPQIIRDYIYFLDKHMTAHVSEAKAMKDKESNKVKKEKTIEEENIGTIDTPIISEKFLSVMKGTSTLVPRDVQRLVEAEIRDEDRRLHDDLTKEGPGALGEAWTKAKTFPSVWAYLKRLSAAYQRAYLIRGGVKTDPAVLEKLMKTGEDADISRRALKETGDAAKALRTLENNMGGRNRGGQRGGGARGGLGRGATGSTGRGGGAKRQSDEPPTQVAQEQQHCFSCGATDHVASACPTKTAKGDKCFNCNEYGHISKDCPKPKRQKKGT